MIQTANESHFWEKFKTVVIRDPERKLYYFMVFEFGVSGFSFKFQIVNLGVARGPLNFCKINYSHFILEVMYHFLVTNGEK